MFYINILVLKNMKIQRPLLNIDLVCRMSIQILKSTNQIENACKLLILFNDVIANLISNRKLDQIITELFIRGTKQNIFIAFITQSCFIVTKEVRRSCYENSDNQEQTTFFQSKILLLAQINFYDSDAIFFKNI